MLEKSRLADDFKLSASRKATHAICYNFYILCIHVVELLTFCVIFIGKNINGAF